MEKEQPKVLYLCDRRSCGRECNKGRIPCNHTAKIEHAVNFKLDGGVYVEQEKEAADEDIAILVDLLKKIKRLEDWRFEHCKHKSGWCSDKDKCEHCEFTK